MMRSPAYKAQLKDWESEAFGGELYSTLGPDINTKFSEKTTEIVVGGGVSRRSGRPLWRA